MFDDDYNYSPYIDDYKYLKEMKLDDERSYWDAHCLASTYEKELCDMLIESFHSSKLI